MKLYLLFVILSLDILAFPGKNISAVVSLEHAFDSLSAFTIMFWLQVEQTGLESLYEPTFLSYATVPESNEIVIFLLKNTGYAISLAANRK